MDLDTRWIAHFEAAVAEISGGALIDGELSSVEVIGVPKQAVSRVMLSLDGGRTLNEVATRIGMPASVVSAICGALSEASLIHKAEVGDRPVPHEEFAELSRRVFAAWKKRLFSHPLWQGLVAGTAPPGQFAGWLMENYQFIEGVNDRLGSATAYCRSRAGRRHFARHFREEYDHGEFFIQGLLALDFSRDAIYASRPLASTSAILPNSSARWPKVSWRSSAPPTLREYSRADFKSNPLELARASASPVVGFTSAAPPSAPTCHLPPR